MLETKVLPDYNKSIYRKETHTGYVLDTEDGSVLAICSHAHRSKKAAQTCAERLKRSLLKEDKTNGQ